MAYFDTTDEDDLAYLPAGYRTATDVDVVATQAEADVIGRYTAVLAPGRLQDLPTDAVTTQTGRTYTSLGDGTAVFLRGYTEDATACTDAALVVAMKRAIADAIVWKLTQETRDTAASAQYNANDKQRTWLPGHDAPLPKHLERHLARWDTREPCWGI